MGYTVNGIFFPKKDGAERTASISEAMFPAYPKDVCADVGVVIGAGIFSLPVVLEAVRLSRNSQIDHLVVCGGSIINNLPETALFRPCVEPLLKPEGLRLPKGRETEADYTVSCLEKCAVKNSSVENKSNNFWELFRNLTKLPVYKEARSVNLIGVLPTRALMTMRRLEYKTRSSSKIATLANVIPFPGTTKDNWAKNQMASSFVRAEFALIDKSNKENHIRKGFCSEVDFRFEISQANTLPIWQEKLFTPRQRLRTRLFSRHP